MDCLLINPGCDIKKSAGELREFLLPMPPIGLAYLAGYLEKNNFTVNIYDDFLNKSNNLKLNNYLDTISAPVLVGLPTFTSSLMLRVFEITKIIRTKFPQTKIIFGNIHANIFKKELIENNSADFIALGEAEETICELLSALKNKPNDYQQIKGLLYKDTNNNLIETPLREPIKDLDKLPFPAWHLTPVKKYEFFPFAKIKEPALLISGSRGCPYQCSFCSLIVHGSKRRVRSAKSIVDEMEYFQKKYGIRQYGFIDPLFPINPKEGLSFCQELIKRNLHKKIVWITETRIDSVNQELLIQMQLAGCRRIMFGIESPSQKNIDNLKKEFDSKKVIETIKMCQKAKLISLGFFIIGLPGETKEDIKNTIKFAIDSGLDFAKFSIYTPYPGTKDFNELKTKGLLNQELITNWNSYTMYPSNDNPPVFLQQGMAIKELVGLQKTAHLRFYFRPRQILLLLQGLNLKDYWRIFLFFWRQLKSFFGAKT